MWVGRGSLWWVSGLVDPVSRVSSTTDPLPPGGVGQFWTEETLPLGIH